MKIKLSYIKKLFFIFSIVSINTIFSTIAEAEPPTAIIHSSAAYAQNGSSGKVSINFNAFDSYDPEAGSLVYYWDFGDGTTSNLPVVRHQFNTWSKQRKFTVTLSVTDNEGNISTATKDVFVDIFVNPIAIAQVETTSSPTSIVNTIYGQAPLTVFFDGSASYVNNESLGEIKTSVWSKISNAVTTEITRNISGSQEFTTGTHTLNLQITNNYGKSSALNSTKVIAFDTTPTTPISVIKVDRTCGMTPLIVSFDASRSFVTGSGVKYLWDFNDGSTSTLINPTHTFSSPDALKERTVTLTVTDSANNQGSSTMKITTFNNNFPVAHPPVITLTANNLYGYAPFEVQFSATAINRTLGTTANIANYAWDFGDGTSVVTSLDSSITHGFSAPGIYKVSLVATDNNSKTGSAETIVTVTASNSARAVIYTPYLLRIAPFTCLFDGHNSIPSMGNKIIKWDWDFGDSQSSDPRTDHGVMVAHRFDNPGTYNIGLTVTDSSGKSNTEMLTLYVAAFYGQNVVYVSSSIGNDTNTGTEALPFATINKALSKGSSPGNPLKILLKSGDSWTINTKFSNSIPTPCFIDSYGGVEKPRIIITFSGNLFECVGSNDPLNMFRLANVHILGEIPIVDPNSVPAGLLKKADLAAIKAPGSAISNCVVENADLSAQLQGYGLTLEETTIDVNRHIYSGGAPGLAFDGNDVIVRRSYIGGAGNNDGLDHQIYGSKGKNWFFENTIFDGKNNDGGVNNFGLKINSGKNVVVRKCEIKNTRNGVAPGANYPDVYGLSENVLIEKCLIHDNGFHNQSAGVYVDGVKNLIIRNNIFYANHPAPTGGKGTITFDAQAQRLVPYDGLVPCIGDIEIYNNVFYNNTIRDIHLENTYFTLSIGNNIFVKDSVKEFYLVNDISKIKSSNNLFFKTYTGLDSKFFYAGPTHYSFNAWTGLGFETGSIVSDPKFAAIEGDYKFSLQSDSFAKDKGLNIPEAPDDYIGVLRPKGIAYDIGAYEFDEGGTPITYSLNTMASNGTVEKNPNNPSYNAGDVVTLTANPTTGYSFANWSGDLLGSNDPETITMNSNKFVTANFTKVETNNPPTITNINNQTINEDASTGAIAFTIGDVETLAANLTLTASSANTALVPNSKIVFGGSGANRTVAITPAPNQSGIATITIAVSDGALTASDNIILTVNPINDAPVISSAAATPTSGIAPLVVNFTAAASDIDGTIASYAWNFGDGTTASQANVSHTYNLNGNYTAVLTVKDNSGATVTANKAIIVSALQSPTAPSSLSAKAISSTAISLTWTDNSSNEQGFVIERATSPDPIYVVATFQLGANATSFTDSGLSAGQTWAYRIKAYNQTGDSAYSAWAGVSTRKSSKGRR